MYLLRDCKHFEDRFLMPHRQIPAAPLRAVEERSPPDCKDDYPIFHCLIVSSEQARREMLSRAASEDGWETIICSDVASAIACSRKLFVQLAMVDLENELIGDLRHLLEHLTRSTGLLTIICGHEDDTQEEIMVRQFGVWLYLPGTAEMSDISLLCSEARHVVERLHSAAQSSVTRKRIGKAR